MKPVSRSQPVSVACVTKGAIHSQHTKNDLQPHNTAVGKVDGMPECGPS